MSLDRRTSDFSQRDIWDKLAEDELSARMVAAGVANSEDLLSSAQATLETITSTIQIFANDIVIDVGAGIGRVGLVMAPLCKTWIGVDVSPQMLKHLRSGLGQLDNVRIVLVDGANLSPLEDDSATVVYSTLVFLHLPLQDQFSYLRESWRVLQAGGRVLVDALDSTTESGQRRLRCAQREGGLLPYYGSSCALMEQLFEAAGFANVSHLTRGDWIYSYASKD